MEEDECQAAGMLCQVRSRHLKRTSTMWEALELGAERHSLLERCSWLHDLALFRRLLLRR